jgi:hypothetical protein
MALREEEEHFGLDSRAGWITPYRIRIAEGGLIRARVTVRNPLPAAATLNLRLVGPKGWRGEPATVAAGPRAEVQCDLAMTVGGRCHRQPIAVELSVGERHFGQIAEALVTVGGDVF